MKRLCFILIFFPQIIHAQHNLQNSESIIEKSKYNAWIPVFRENIKTNPYDINTWQVLTEAYLKTNQPDSALHVSQRSREYFPRNIKLFTFYAELFWQASCYKSAAFWIEKLYQIEKTDEIRILLSNAYHNIGVQESQSGNWKQAVKYFRKALEHNTDLKESYRALSAALTQIEAYAEALKIIDRAFEKYPDYRELLEIQKYILVQTKDFKALEEKLQEYVTRNPDELEIRLELNRIRNAIGRSQVALSDLEKLKNLHPENPQIYQELSSLQHKYSQFEKERNIYLEMLERHPDADTLYFKIANTYQYENKWKEARQNYRLYLKKKPEDIATYLSIAKTYKRESLPDSAIIFYQKVIEFEPGHVQALESAGKTAEEIGKLEQALRYYEQLAKYLPNSADPLVLQGQVLEKIRQKDTALQKYEKAETIEKKAMSAYRLFIINKEKKDLEKAEQYQMKALERTISEISKRENAVSASLSTGENIFLADSKFQEAQDEAKSLESMRNIIFDIVQQWIPDQQDISLENALKNILKEYPDAPIVLQILADVYASKEDYDNAEKFYNKFLFFRPRSSKGLRGLATVYENQGSLDEAFLTNQKIVELDLSNRESYPSIIRVAEKAGKLENLAQRWEQLYRAHKDNTTLKQHLILVWNKLGRNDKVMQIIGE